jgi:hypothetical protein
MLDMLPGSSGYAGFLPCYNGYVGLICWIFCQDKSAMLAAKFGYALWLC